MSNYKTHVTESIIMFSFYSESCTHHYYWIHSEHSISSKKHSRGGGSVASTLKSSGVQVNRISHVMKYCNASFCRNNQPWQDRRTAAPTRQQTSAAPDTPWRNETCLLRPPSTCHASRSSQARGTTVCDTLVPPDTPNTRHMEVHTYTHAHTNHTPMHTQTIQPCTHT